MPQGAGGKDRLDRGLATQTDFRYDAVSRGRSSPGRHDLGERCKSCGVRRVGDDAFLVRSDRWLS